MTLIDLGDVTLNMERAGQGTPLLFISGTGADLRNRPNQLDSPLVQHFDVITYDQRGLGQSSNPPEPFSMAQYADDAARLLDALALSQVLVMGVSFGGMVAQELMLRHPDRVRAAVWACTSAGGAGGASYPLHKIAELPDRERVEVHLKAADLRHTDAWIEEHPQQWEKRVALALAAQRPDRDPVGAAKQLAARADHNTFARLGQIQVPMLLAGGRHDGVAPVANQHALDEALPHSELQLFDGGHMFLVQDKTAYPEIISWLNTYS